MTDDGQIGHDGQIGYEAYGQAADWLTFDKRRMPSWADLGLTEVGRETQRRWDVAAAAIVKYAAKHRLCSAMEYKARYGDDD